jgi:predicted phage terminase large subunit-like protein
LNASKGQYHSKQAKLSLLREQQLRQASRNLAAFTTFTKPDYEVSWHHAAFCKVLDRFISGDIKRLMVFMPPQHGKSELATRRLAAKMLGDHPNKRLAVVAYNHTLAAKFNRDIQRIIDSPEYGKVYPNTSLYGKNIRSVASGSYLRNTDEFEIVGHTGSLISVGVGGGLTGNKVDCAIIDDPYKDAATVNSAAYRSMIEEWWDSVLETRLHNDSQVCLTFTRWRDDDIAGYLLEKAKHADVKHEWHIVRFEAIKEHEQVEGDPRAPGEALWPERHSLERLEGLRATNPQVFEAMFQQRPTPKGGNKVKGAWLKTYEPGEVPASVPTHCYIDTATSEKELKGNDPSGLLFYKAWRNCIYLVAFYKGRWGINDLISNAKRLYALHCDRRSRIYIENKSNGRTTQQLLKKDTTMAVILENPEGDKEERLENELPSIEAGRVLLPIGELWVDDFKSQLLGFPKMKHDEEVDCLTGAMRMGLGKQNSTGVRRRN